MEAERGWTRPEQINLDTGEKRQLVRRVVVVGGMTKIGWLDPDQDAKVATSGVERLPETVE